MAPSTRRRGVRRISGEGPVSAADERVDSSGSSIGSTLDHLPRDRPASFSIHFTNIRGLNSNLPSVEHHLATFLPNILLLSETQLSSDASSTPFQISHYNLYSKFRLKGGVCAYCNINTPIARFTKLDNPLYDVIWLKISLRTTTIFLCFCYCSPNSTDFASFFDYLSMSRESLLTSHPQAEVLILGDFNVHHTEWLSSTTTDVGGNEARFFSIINEMEQIIKQPTRVPDRHDHAANILDLCFTSNPCNYSYSISAPLGSSDHKLISITSTHVPPPPIPPTKRQLWFYDQAQKDNIRMHLLDFPFNEYCFRSDNPEEVLGYTVEVFTSTLDAYVPSTTKTFSSAKPWFDRGCSRTVKSKEQAHLNFNRSPSQATHSSFNSARNRCTSQLHKKKDLYVKRKSFNTINSLTEKSFWSLANNVLNNFCKSNFPPLIRADGSIANTPTEKANLFGSLFSANSFVNTSNVLDPLTPPSSNFMPFPTISVRKVRRALASLKIGKASGPDRIPVWFLKEFAAEIAPVLCRLFRVTRIFLGHK